MTLEYFDRWASWPPSAIAADVAGMQWSHFILQEPTYKSPWQASEDAMQLAFMMQPSSFIEQCERPEWGFSVPHRRHRKGLTVSFDPLVSVHFGPEFNTFWTTSRVPTAEVSQRDWLPKSSVFSQSLCIDFDDSTSSQSSLIPSSSTPMMHRPDPTENPNLPDPPSSSEGSDGRDRQRRAPLRHFPAWVETLWNILQDEGATELLEEGPVIYLTTYYLSHRNCVRQAVDRPIRLTRRYDEWIEEFKQVWGDLFDREADFDIFLVRPEPPISITRGIVGIVLIVQHAQPGGAAVLTTALFDELPTPRTLEIAHIVDIWTDYATALHRAEAFEACREAERQDLRPCVLRAGPHVFPRERPIRMHNGLGLVVNVPMLINEEEWNYYIRPRMEQWADADDILQPEQHEEADHAAMMARRPYRVAPTSSSSSTSAAGSTTRSRSREPSSGTSTWLRTVVFTSDGHAVPCLLPEDQHQEFLRRIATALEQEEIAETFTVVDRPEDLVAADLQCILALRNGERRPISFLRFTLLDLEIIESNEVLPGAFRRLAKWLPHTTTQISLFRLLCIEDVVRRHRDKTHLWINNNAVDLQQDGPFMLEDGDYVKVFIGDDDQRFNCDASVDEASLLQGPGIRQSKVGEKHVPPSDHFDICGRRHGRRHRTPGPPAAETVDPEHRRLQEIWNRPHLQSLGTNNEPIMYFETWFLSALDFPRCSTSRLAALPAQVHLWEGALRQVWRDRQHPPWPVNLQLIYPTPVGAAHGGHLLILQHEHPGEAGVLLTTLGSPPTDQFAQLVPGLLPYDRLLWFADQETRCEDQQWVCHAEHNHRRLYDNGPWRAENGQHIEIHVKRRPEHGSHVANSSTSPWRPAPPQHSQPTSSIDDFVMDPTAPPFVPGVAPLETMPEVIQDLHEEWTRTAVTWQGEQASAEIVTWFVDQQDPQQRVCWHPRNLRLTSQFAMWEHNIHTLWRDRILAGAQLEIVLVQPRPPQQAVTVAAHAIVIQRPQPEMVTSLITVYDNTVNQPGPIWQLALTTWEHIFLEQFIHSLGLTYRCLMAGADRQCDGWYGAYRLILGRPLQGRDGYGIVLLLSERPPAAPAQHVAMIQTQVSLRPASATMSAEEQDLDEPPLTPIPLPLAQLIPEIEVVKVKAADHHQPMPQFIEIPKNSDESGVAEELAHWGLRSPVFRFGIRGDYLYFNAEETPGEFNLHYMLCHDDVQDENGSILHTSERTLEDKDLMRLLHRLGYERTVILSTETLLPSLCRVRFWNCTPTAACDDRPPRVRTSWPRRAVPYWTPSPLFPARDVTAALPAQCQVQTPFNSEDIVELLQAGKDTLCTDFTGLDLPSFIEEVITSSEPGRLDEAWDRWLIFTDGSSQTKNKHYTPEFADAMTMPDTWAMIVLGERYTTDTDSIVVPLGWQAHPVRTDPQGSCFVGSTRIGADVAEREGLLWAGLWRLSQNSIVPTVFCVDSQITGGQAAGTIGVSEPDLTYRLLRGTFQCLQAGLPLHHLEIHHVRSHTGDPYNEFVDHVAKREAQNSFHHRRLTLNMQKWQHFLPYLWLVFARDRGLPAWDEGLHVSAPDLPIETLPGSPTCDHKMKTSIIACQLGIATMNVLSISKGPMGHGGKLYYLFEQVKAHCLNVVGVQEGRNEEVFSTSHDILRIGAGHCGGQYGVELWVNLRQPVGYDCREKPQFLKVQDFQVCHKDAQRLIVRCQADLLVCWFFVAHAPHSGHTRAMRQTWWDETDHLMDQFDDGTPWIWMIDANAAPGDADDLTVFTPGLATSANTDMFRSCLQRHGLCLASTLACHQGPRTTWTSPDGEKEHCIDYVAIPCIWKHACTFSSVIETMDLCTTNDDHKAIGLQLEWSAVSTTVPAKLKKSNPNWNSPAVRSHMKEQLTTLAHCPWHADVEVQAQHLSSALHKTMKSSTQAPRVAKKPYITAELWAWRTHKLKLKQSIHDLQRQAKRQLLRQVLQSWKHGQIESDTALGTISMSQSQAAGRVQKLLQKAPKGIEAGKTNSPQRMPGQFVPIDASVGHSQKSA